MHPTSYGFFSRLRNVCHHISRHIVVNSKGNELVIRADSILNQIVGKVDLSKILESPFGYFRPVIGDVARRYLACGDIRRGFARVRCPECGHEYLLAFSCKGRYFCTSCHTKRAVAFAGWLNEEVLWPVPHRQVVLTVPKMLRPFFRYDRTLLGELCRAAASVITESFRSILGNPGLDVGVVACIHTFGNFVNFHPHIHALVTDGGFTAGGTFHVLPKISLSGMERLFRRRVLLMLLEKGKIRPERVRMLLLWVHSGFNLDA